MDITRIGIIGVGQVGMAAAYSLFHRRLASELVLVDLDLDRATGEAMDLLHGQALVGRTAVRAGSVDELTDTDLVVISAGVGQRPGESRLDLLQRNVDVMAVIVDGLDRACPDAVLLVATNPVDVLTHAVQELSARPRERVIGTGTALDSARLRSLVGERYDVDPQSVHGLVLGEHGDSEVVAWSTVSVNATPVLDREVLGVAWDPAAAEAISTRVRRAAAEIIERKGYTNLAIGVVISSLADAVLNDRRAVHPVTVRADGRFGLTDVSLSLPARLDRTGVRGIVEPDLVPDELDALRRSAGVLAEAASSLRLG
jgi:L-lactate dehydrogenase